MRPLNTSLLTMIILPMALLVPVGNWGIYRGGEALAQELQPLFPSQDFTCYVINRGIAPKESVTLDDQFPLREVVVREPQILCAPTAKTRVGGVTPSIDEQGPHLKCYTITPAGPPVNETVTLCDQFHDCTVVESTLTGGEQVQVQTAQYLCTLACKNTPLGDCFSSGAPAAQ